MFQFIRKEQENEKKENVVQRAEPQRENRTGIPAQLKDRIEGSSGMSLDDVRVHYNSDRPAKLNALAYTQGNQVEIAPGQERHLAHELGHVVQQKLRAVRANARHASGVAMNTDPVLERQADEIGAGKTVDIVQRMGDNVVQRMMQGGVPALPAGGVPIPPAGGVPAPPAGGVPAPPAGAGGAQNPLVTHAAMLARWNGYGNRPSDDVFRQHVQVFTNPQYYNQTTGAIQWPPNRGFLNQPISVSLPAGSRVDRYGYEGGTFVSPLGVPYTSRSLAPGTDKKPYHIYEVRNNINNVQSGLAAPWFGERGMGVQYELPDTVSNLKNRNDLEDL